MEDQLKTFAMIYTSTASIKPSDNLRSPSHKEISGHTSLLSSDTSVAKFGSATASSTSSNDTTPSESFLKGKATKGLTHAFNQNYTTEVCWEVHKSKYCSKNTSRLDTSLEDFDGVSQNDNEVGNEESICDNYATENDEYNDVFDNDSVSETAKNSGKMESTLRPSNAIDMEDRSQDYADLREIDGITLESRLSLSENYVRDTFTIDYDRTGWREIDLFLKEKNDLDKSQTCSYTQCNSTDASETNRGNSIVNETDNAETDFNGANDSDTEINDNEKYNSIFSETDITDKNFESADEIEKECNETELGNTDCDETDIADTENNETDEDETDMDRSDTYETDTDRPETDKTSISSTAKSFKDAEDSNSTGGDNKDQQGNAMISYHGELELERPILQKARTKWHRLSTNMELESPDREHKCLRSRHSWLRCNSYEKESTVSLKRHIETPFSQESNSLEYDSMSMKSESTSPTQELTSAIRAMSVMRSRLANLRKIIHDKNEKIRELKARMKVEKTNSRCRELMAQREKQNRQSMEVVSSAELLHLRRELAALRQEKERLKAELATKAAMEKERMVEVRKLKQEHERQLKLVKMEARKEEVRENRELSLLQRTIMAKEKELRERQLVIHKLECEKLYLGEEIYRITGVEEGFWSDQTLARPLLTEKERCLVRRNSSLNTQLSRLQIHCKTLSSENSTLKNKMEVELERPLELKEKDRHRQREMQLLKKKNTELASITRKLEEKVKSLEKKTKESPATERRNLMQARQREKEALYEKQLLERDREIQRLKLRMRELVRKLTGKNGEITRAQSTLELEQIIRTVTKERLQLERHLAAASEGLSRGGSGEADVGRLASLEETNNTLRQQLEDLELLTRQHHTLQRHVQEKDLECVTLKEKLKLKNELCHDLESQLARVIEKNTELTIQNSDLQKQIQELQHVSEECRTLKHTLTQVETDWSSAKVQVGSLQNKFGNLESVLRLEDVYGFADGSRPRGGSSLETVLIQMKDAADKRRDLERQHAEALAQLRERQASIADPSKANEKERKASVEVVEALQSKIRELEKKAEVQNLRHEELLLEMQSLKKAQGSPKNSWTRSLSADLQSPDSGDVTPGLNSLNSISSGVYTNTTSSSFVTSGSGGFLGTSPLPSSGTVENASSEIDRIMAKIEQDNKILAELDKSRSTIDKNLMNGNIPGLMLPPYETDNRVLDVLEIPGKGRCHVYIARYSYDPFQHSPNENPEAELAVNAGDYVLVWGSMDEDGFFDGELLDGRRGLVPSNFVEKLIGEDLIEFHQSVVMGLRDGDESMSTSVPQDLDFISQDESQLMIDLATNQIRHNAYTSNIDLEDIIEEDEETLGEHVPPPVQLTLERQLNKSIVIGWNPPPDAPQGSIESYHVYVNGLLKTTVRATERTRALVEGVDSTKLHRISVRSVTPNRRTSRDAACTMVIGKDAPLGPTSVKATSITSTSAVISWLPSNSNFQHTVCVNNVEVRTVKPGVYRHTITGLSPNTTYRVTIRAKNLRAPQFDEKATRNQDRLSTTIEFRTLPKDPKGLPDPPVDVQVEPGPQDGSLLVTWLPVTINSTGGTSNGAPVTGYAVYADGKKVTEVESPTGDHALIDLTKIPGFEPKQVTVRTKSRDSVSGDSVPSQIPTHFGRGRGRGKDMHADGHKPGPQHGLPGPHHGPVGPHHGPPGPHASGPGTLRDRLLGRRGAPAPGVRTDHLGQTILDHEDNLSDKEIYPGHQQGQQGPHAPIPAIGKGASRVRQITKDNEGHGSLEAFNEEDYEVGPGGRGRFDPRAPPPRSHQERGRPPPPPHQHRPLPRDVREPREGRDPRDPHYREGRDPRDPRERRDPHMREPHPPPRDPRDPRDRYEGEGRHRGGEYGREYGRGEGRGRAGSGPTGDQHTRIFVALFDYDPPTMSPNPDACDEELGFREGQLIKVFGDKDPDGFYWGEAGGHSGYVPCNMVSEVQVDDDRVAQELLKESETGRRRRDGSVGRRGHQGDRWGDIYANMPIRKMIAMYDYDPQELSPNVDSEVELSFQTGDIIYVYGDMDDDGFYMGELRGQRGLVPSNFLQDAPQDYADDHRSRRDTLDPRDRPGPPGPSVRGPGPGAHGPPPPPRPDQRDRRKDEPEGTDQVHEETILRKGMLCDLLHPTGADQRFTHQLDTQIINTRSVASRSLTSSQDMKGAQGALGDHHQDPGTISSAAERGGRSVSRERGVNKSSGTLAGAAFPNTTSSAGTPATTAASRAKLNGLDLLDEDPDNGPTISSADLDQLMEDFDLNDPLEEDATSPKPVEHDPAASKEGDIKEEKPGGLAGALPGGLGAGLSGIPNPMGEGNLMGKLGDLATQNPVTDVMSKGKDFLFKKFGL